MKFSKKNAIFVFCVLFFCLLPAVALEAAAVLRLGETVPRGILFGSALFALWLVIWVLGFRVMVAMWARQPIANPVGRFRAELADVIRIWTVGSCAIILFILFPWVQGFPMPYCSVLALKVFWVCCIGCSLIAMWGVLRIRKGLRAQKRAQSSATEELEAVGQGKGKMVSGDLSARGATSP